MGLTIYNHEAQYQSARNGLDWKPRENNVKRKILKSNKNLIIDFDRQLKLDQKGIKRRCKYLSVLATCAELLKKPFVNQGVLIGSFFLN